MGKGGEPKTRRKAVPSSPINFRMPKPLRTRLDSFARARHLGEAQALRLVVSEHLDEVESAADLAAAERWQYEQAFAEWERFRRGEGRTVPRGEIQRIFQSAREPAPVSPSARPDPAAARARTKAEHADRSG